MYRLEAIEQPYITPKVLQEFVKVRRTVYDTQIHPSLQATAAFLSYEQPTCQENIGVPINVPNREGLIPQRITPVILTLDKNLGEAISKAESDRKYGSYGVSLFSKPFSRLLSSYQTDVLHYSRAAEIFLHALEGDTPLKLFLDWDEAVEAIEKAGKRAPQPPEEIIWASGDDGGSLNERLAIELPTKAPHLFVEYLYRAWGRREVDRKPYHVGVSATTIDRYYPHYPFQRFH